MYINFDDGFRVAGIKIENQNAESFEKLYFLLGDFKESGAEFLCYCGVFESCRTGKRDLPEAF